MSKITYRVNYAMSFARGVDCPQPPIVTVDVDPATLSDEDRNTIASRLNQSGDVCSRSAEGYWLSAGDHERSLTRPERRDPDPGSRGHWLTPTLVLADTPRLEDLLAAIRAEDAAIARYAAAEAAAEGIRARWSKRAILTHKSPT